MERPLEVRDGEGGAPPSVGELPIRRVHKGWEDRRGFLRSLDPIEGPVVNTASLHDTPFHRVGCRTGSIPPARCGFGSPRGARAHLKGVCSFDVNIPVADYCKRRPTGLTDPDYGFEFYKTASQVGGWLRYC